MSAARSLENNDRGIASVAATIARNLSAAGLRLPPPPPAAGAYRPAILRGQFGFVSGQFPLRDGKSAYRGRIGAELSLAEGRAAARLAALNTLAQIESALPGWNGFGGLARVQGYFRVAPDFDALAGVLDAASELFVAVLGPELGSHARAVFAVDGLPFGAPLELVVDFALDPPKTAEPI